MDWWRSPRLWSIFAHRPSSRRPCTDSVDGPTAGFVCWIMRSGDTSRMHNTRIPQIKFSAADACLVVVPICTTDHICPVTCCWQMLSSRRSVRMRLLEWIKITLPPRPTQPDFYSPFGSVCSVAAGRFPLRNKCAIFVSIIIKDG